MATRVNTKFVAILCGSIVVLVAAVGTFYYFKLMEDPAQLKARGDRLMAEGKIQNAVLQYGKAIQQRSNDPELLLSYYEALRQKPVDDRREAQQTMQDLHNLLRQASALRPADDELLAKYYNRLLAEARRLGNADSVFDQIYQQADEKLTNDPENLVARKFRGIAQVHLLAPVMTAEEQNQARDDLQQVLKQKPADAEALYHLARWHLFQAKQAELNNNAQRASQMRQKALSVSKRLMTPAEKNDAAGETSENDNGESGESGQAPAEEAQAGNDASTPMDAVATDRLLKRAKILLDAQLNRIDQARPVVDTLEQRMLKDPTPPRRVWSVAQLIARISRTAGGTGDDITDAGLKRMQALLESSIEQSPNLVTYRLHLGRLLQQQGKLDAAIETLEKALSVEITGNALEVRRASGRGQAARLRLARLLLTKAERTEEEGKKAKLFDRVESLADALADQDASPLQVKWLRGRLALQRGNIGEAVEKLSDASEQAQGNHPRLTRLAAEAYLQAGEWGKATEQLERLSSAFEDAISLRLKLARIYLEHNSLEKAADHIQTVLDQEPNNAAARRLQATLLVQRKQFDKAIPLFERLAEQQPTVIPILARLYAANDQPAKAKQLLRKRLDEAPADLRGVRLMMQLTEDRQQQRALVENAAEAGLDSQMVELLRNAVEGQDDSPQARQARRRKIFEDMIGRQKDPAQKALMRARVALTEDDPETARQVLDSALKQKPDNEALLRMRFEVALQYNPDASRADELVQKAGDLNLDSVGGDKWAGRLALARGNIEEAVAALRRAVNARQVDSEAQRLLGDALRRRENPDLDATVEAYEKAIAQRPDNLRALTALAELQAQRGNMQAALERVRQAHQYHPDNDQVREQYLRFEARFGDRQVALQERMDLADSEPGNLTNRRRLVALLATMDRGEDAIERARALIEDAGRTRQTVATLASAYRAAGEPGRGIDVIEQYIDSRGDQAGVFDYMLLGRFHLAQGNGQQAMAAYERARQLEDPERMRATQELAQVLFRNGRNERAASLYQTLYRKMPEREAVGQRWVEALIRSGQTDQAARVLDQLPDSANTKAMRGLVAMQRQKFEQARQLLDASLDNEPEQPFTLLQRARLRLRSDEADLEAARNDLSRAIELAPDLHPARFTLAQVQLQLNNTDAAIGQLRELLSRNPDHGPGRLSLAKAYRSADQPGAARQVLEAGRQQFPDQAIWSRRLASLAAQAGNTEAALEAWRQAVEIEPSRRNLLGLSNQLLGADRPEAVDSLLTQHSGTLNASPRLQAVRAHALGRLGKMDQARNLFRVTLKNATDPGAVTAAIRRMAMLWSNQQVLSELESLTPKMQRPEFGQFAQARLLMIDQRFEATQSTLKQLLASINLDNNRRFWLELQQMRGTCFQKLGEAEQARACYERVLEYNPNNVDALNNLAYLLATELGDPQRAVALAKRATKQNPNAPQILDTLGWAQFKAGALHEARNTLQRSVELRPLPHNHLHLGRVFIALDVPTRARTLLKQAIELAENNKDTRVADEARAALSELAQATQNSPEDALTR